MNMLKGTVAELPEKEAAPAASTHYRYGGFLVPILGPWVLDFSQGGWRQVFMGPEPVIRASFKDWFGPEMVGVMTDRGPQMKVNPESDLLLFGFGPLMDEERIEVNRLAVRTKKFGPWFEEDAADAIFMRRVLWRHAREAGAMDLEEWLGTYAPESWLTKYQAVQERQRHGRFH